MEPPSLQSKKTKTAVNVIRSLTNIKSLMEKRDDQRATVIYHMANGRFPNSLIYARQLIYTSQKIWRQFDDEYREGFEQNYFFKTSKNKQFTEYLLDNVLISKIFLKSKKFEDIIEIIDKIELPEFNSSRELPRNNQEQIILFNEAREVENKICGCLLTLIEIVKQDKKIEPVIKLFSIYIQFVRQHYGKFQLATAEFKFGSYFYEIKEYQKALDLFNDCIEIRKKNSLNEGYVDVLINSSICLRQMGKLKEAIERTRQAIEIYEDLNKPDDENYALDDYYLFMYKLKLENGQFMDAYKNIVIAYKIRSEKDSQNPKRIQAELNLLFFYKTLMRVKNDSLTDSVFNIKDRKEIARKKKQGEEVLNLLVNSVLNREEFVKYDDFNARMAHLTLTITEPFFDKLTSEQVVELEALLTKLGSCSFQKGLNQLFKSTFFDNFNTRQLLLQANPHLVKKK